MVLQRFLCTQHLQGYMLAFGTDVEFAIMVALALIPFAALMKYGQSTACKYKKAASLMVEKLERQGIVEAPRGRPSSKALLSYGSCLLSFRFRPFVFRSVFSFQFEG